MRIPSLSSVRELGAGGHGSVSLLLVSSYVVDWVIILAITAIGAGFSRIGPRQRPFDITDRSLSYPLESETVTNSTLLIAALIAPAAVILIGSLFVGTGPGRKPSSKAASWRRKLWEWNTGWMGLALSLAIAFIIANGAKEVLGKPRPNLLARCSPDLSKRLEATVGGIGDQIEEGITLYNTKICRNHGAILDEGFRSFPSGHSAFSFAGLVYLAFWLCAKLGISIPFLSPRNYNSSKREGEEDYLRRTQAAAPPAWLILFPLIPVGAAMYISSTRYSDFWHHGFDVFTSSILGTATAWLGFRWYHMPIRRGGGWAWAPRSPKRAYWKSMGVLTYADNEDEPRKMKDVEARGGMVGNHFLPPPGSRNVGTSGSGGSGSSSEGYEMRNFGPPRVPVDFTAYEREDSRPPPVPPRK